MPLILRALYSLSNPQLRTATLLGIVAAAFFSTNLHHSPMAGKPTKTGNRRITAGLIIIGDEILNGSTNDTNSHFLCSRLHRRGVSVSVVGDHVDEIATEIRDFSHRFDVVLTTGGIGPTHDDRTFEGLGRAFGDQLQKNLELCRVVEVFLKKTKLKDVDAAVEKFCRIPRSATLLWGRTPEPKEVAQMNRFPSVQLNNVICFPGVPKFCELAFEQLEDTIFPITSVFYNRTLYFQRNEVYLQEQLSEIAEAFRSDVDIGSYPIMDNTYFKTKVVVESLSDERGNSAYERIRDTFSDYLVNYDEEAWLNTVEKFDAFRSSIHSSNAFSGHLDRAVTVMEEIFNNYRLDEIAIAFNGGKDCTALLHLVRTQIDKRFGPDTRLQAFHILCGEEFPEMADFIREAAKKYRLDMNELNGPMKSGLEELQKRRPNVKVVIMGSRHADPNGRYMKSETEWTDEGWPRFYRVCPLLRWHYVEVWRLLRSLCVPYCPLYDRGYTSLGQRTQTFQNEALRKADGKYLPAYMLTEEALERDGRLEAETPKL